MSWVIAANLDRQFLFSQFVRRGSRSESDNLPAIVEAASQPSRIGLALLGAESGAEKNHSCMRRQLGDHNVIAINLEKKTWRIRGVCVEMRSSFTQRAYRHCTLIETLFFSPNHRVSARVS